METVGSRNWFVCQLNASQSWYRNFIKSGKKIDHHGYLFFFEKPGGQCEEVHTLSYPIMPITPIHYIWALFIFSLASKILEREDREAAKYSVAISTPLSSKRGRQCGSYRTTLCVLCGRFLCRLIRNDRVRRP